VTEEFPVVGASSKRFARTLIVVALLVSACVVGGLAWFLAASQASARHSLVERLGARVQLGAEFTTLYADDLFARERQVAESWLAADVNAKGFARASAGLGLPAAMLLNARGRLLAITPDQPRLIGRSMSLRFPDLDVALAGRPTVSNVVRVADRTVPVVEIAEPFATVHGRRVLSGAFVVSHTLLGAYVKHLTTLPGRQVYLVDSAGALIASSNGAEMQFGTLRQAAPLLAAAIARSGQGVYESNGVAQQYYVSRVARTPWRVVLAVPQAALFESAGVRWLPWLAVIGLALASVLSIFLIVRLQRSRARLHELNTVLDTMAHVDALTALPNRRAIEQSLRDEISSASRHGQAVSVLLVDIDHFKQINDTHGHDAGDAALRVVAATLESALRTEDMIGRWGGEEFLGVLRFTNVDGAVVVAERLRQAIASAYLPALDAVGKLSVTIGVAEWSGDSLDDLLRNADEALYAGKDAGRNCISIARGAAADVVASQSS
jgi:diguanylate cyclase (GGDEF)-like protein